MKPEKNGPKVSLQFFSSNFQILGNFEACYRVSAPAGPQNRPKTPNGGQKTCLGITLARAVTGRMTPPFPCTLRVPDRFRRVRDPNGTIWTTCVPPGGPAGPGWAGSENFFGQGSRGSEKNFRQEFFCPKTLFIGSWVGFGPQKTDFRPL